MSHLSTRERIPINEAATMLGVSGSAIYSWAKTHNVKFVKAGRYVAISTAELNLYIAQRRRFGKSDMPDLPVEDLPAEDLLVEDVINPASLSVGNVNGHAPFEQARMTLNTRRSRLLHRRDALDVQLTKINEEREFLTLQIEETGEHLGHIDSLERALQDSEL